MPVLTREQRANVTGRCHRCYRTMRGPDPGLYCRDCGNRLGRAVDILLGSEMLPAQRAAQDLIEGRLEPARPGVMEYYYRPPNGARGILVTPDNCPCAGGRHGITCHHRVAATILAA